MDDNTLEKLSISNEKYFFNITPWVCWESENSSFGKCFRKWAFYPKFLPLFMCSAHTAYNGSNIWPNEIDDRARLFWGWPKKKIVKRINKYKKKESYIVAHPWIYYRRKYIGNPPKKRNGILYFFPHSNTYWEPKFTSIDKMIKYLKILGQKHNGITICLSFHDIKKGLHKKLRKYSIPLVTAGNTNSHLFINRFYSLIYNYRFTSSSRVGAQTYYSIEAGIPHFLINQKFNYIGTGISKPKSQILNEKYFYNIKEIKEMKNFEKSLNRKTKIVSEFQKKFVLNKLGYFDSIKRIKGCYLLWRELMLNFHRLPFLYFRVFLAKIKKIFYFMSNFVKNCS